jgi:hypothetical protein
MRNAEVERVAYDVALLYEDVHTLDLATLMLCKV